MNRNDKTTIQMIMDKFKGKYRTKSIRLEGWDYRNKGKYFITICTKNRHYFFGDVVDTKEKNKNRYKVKLSSIGKIAQQYWLDIPNHFPHIGLDEFVIMPNHIHGILTIKEKPAVENKETQVNNKEKNQQMACKSPKPGSISTIIRSYKSAVTRDARKVNLGFGWQSKFHDRIIRSQMSYLRIVFYIKNNPKRWEIDSMHKQNNL